MSVQFPTAIYTPRETENLPGIVYDPTQKQNMFSEDFQNLGNEINAIEEALGENLENVPLKSLHFCKVQLSADQIVLANAIRGFRLEADDVVTDTNNDYIISNYYGADGAYEQANSSGCSTTNIQRKSGSVPYSFGLKYCLVEWSSTVDGVTNYGKGYINDVLDSSNLNMSKLSGADFANNYYYRVRKLGYLVPVTGLYQIFQSSRISVAEDQKRYNFDVLDPTIEFPIPYTSNSVSASGSSTLVVPSSGLVYLTAGQLIVQRIKTYGLSANLTLTYAEYQNYFSIMLIKAT